jgi:hypothetical protein
MNNRIDRPTTLGTIGRQLGVNPGKINHGDDLANELIVGIFSWQLARS